MNKFILLTLAALLAVPAALADPNPPNGPPVGPPTGSTCPLGYDPNAFANICDTNQGNIPTAAIGFGPQHQCIVGNATCVPIPTVDLPLLTPSDMHLGHGLYIDVLCNQKEFTCGCATLIQPNPADRATVIICTPFFRP